MWVFLLILCAMVSSMLAAYLACFGEATGTILIIDSVMEIMFIVEMVRTFFTSYIDVRNPRKPVKDIFLIARHYLRGPFGFELLAISSWPLRVALQNSLGPDKVNLLYLLRILRISKILILLDLQKFAIKVRHKYRMSLNNLLEKKDATKILD